MTGEMLSSRTLNAVRVSPADSNAIGLPKPLLVDVCIAVSGPAPGEYVDLPRAGLRLGPGAAYAVIADEFFTALALKSFVGNPHTLYGRAVMAVIEALVLRDVINVDDGNWASAAFKLRVRCNHTGTRRYIERYVQTWKAKNGVKPDGKRPRDWEMWERLNALCALGKVVFLPTKPHTPARSFILALHRRAAFAKKGIRRPRTKAAMIDYNEVWDRTHPYIYNSPLWRGGPRKRPLVKTA